MENTFFMHRIKKEGGLFDKGIEVKETYEAAKQSYHAYLGAYAYGQKDSCEFVQCMITDISGIVLMDETWLKAEEPEPDPEPEPEPEPPEEDPVDPEPPEEEVP